MKNGSERGLYQRSPDEPTTVKKIEIGKPEDFGPQLDDFDFGSDYNEDMLDAELAEAEARAEAEREPLSYIPFDATAELQDIRKFWEDEALTIQEKRRVRSEKIREFKKELLHQKEGIAFLIGDLRAVVESAPNTSFETLRAHVRGVAPKYRLSRQHLYLFDEAIAEYRKKHEAVEKYRTLYPNDADFFEACFGKKPNGKIEIIKGPMMLFFRCFESEDYDFAYNFPKHRGDETKLNPTDGARAVTSGGGAISRVKIPELVGVVTVENVRSNGPRFEIQSIPERQEIIHDSRFNLPLNDLKGDVTLEVVGVGVWEIRLTEGDEPSGDERGIQLFKLNGKDASLLSDIHLSATKDGETLRAVEGQYWTSLEVDGEAYGHIHISFRGIEVVVSSKEGTIVTYKENNPILIPNEEYSERVRVHEDQHQFNKLFVPTEERELRRAMMQRAVEGTKTPEEAVERLIHGLVKMERKLMGFDAKVRDEVLAYYTDGRSAEAIFKLLTESELYDYVRQYEATIIAIPNRIKNRLLNGVSEVYYEGERAETFISDVQSLEIDESTVAPHIESIFKDEYKADLQIWLNAISSLEQKGYEREEILALFSQEPINRWSNLARRMRAK